MSNIKIYVASRFKNANTVVAFSAKLMTLLPDVECIQTWTNEAAGATRPKWLAALQDLTEIDESDVLLQLTEDCDLVPGGMHFEMGYAFARGKKLVIVGPKTHVFHHMSNVQWFPSIQEFLTYVQARGRF